MKDKLFPFCFRQICFSYFCIFQVKAVEQEFDDEDEGAEETVRTE